MPGYVVAPNTQVNVEGTVHGAGEEVPLTESEAASLLLAGTVSTVGTESPPPARQRARRQAGAGG